MKEALLYFALSQLIFSPVYVALYVDRLERQREAENGDYRQEEDLDEEIYREILLSALNAFKKAGMGVPYISGAIDSGELDQELALTALALARRDTMRWADDSTDESRKHWQKVSELFDKYEYEIKGEGE